ncbi:MAG: GNAT family N-acetyltransferase [Candidatus Lokiarchaeota archaeon]|nr:GNAT family N-acetyltransferase [Candidatus Lokiarchaeota archaeon]
MESKFTITENLDDSRIIPFLLKDDGASIFHHPGWLKAIKKSFNHKPFYLLQLDDFENLVGLIPFLLFNSKIFGKQISILPYSTYCDPLISNELLPNAIMFIRNFEKKFYNIEFRLSKPFLGKCLNLISNQDYILHQLRLTGNEESTLGSFHRKAVRVPIRKLSEMQVNFRLGNTLEDLKLFYEIEVSFRKALGFPAFPFSFFQNLWEEFYNKQLLYLPIIDVNNIPIAAGLALKFKKTFYLEHSATNKKSLSYFPYHKIYWEMIKIAIDQDMEIIDFGRTSKENQTLITFKDRWNTIQIPLYHVNSNQIQKHKTHPQYFNIVKKINTLLPKSLLKLESNLIYRHLG